MPNEVRFSQLMASYLYLCHFVKIRCDHLSKRSDTHDVLLYSSDLHSRSEGSNVTAERCNEIQQNTLESFSRLMYCLKIIVLM